MGWQREFVCPACAYAEIVAGGEDVGMLVATQTIRCAQCRKLFDAIDSRFRHLADGTTIADPVTLRCPRSRSHEVVPWCFPDACPRCGATMEVKPDGLERLWD